MSGFQNYLHEMIKSGEMTDKEFRGMTDLYIEFSREKQAVKKTIMRNIIKMEYELGQYFKLLKGYEEKISHELKEMKKRSDQKYFSFITINMDDSKTINRPGNDPTNQKLFFSIFIKSYVDKALKKNWINKYMWVVEQRGIEPDFKGIHIHILLDKKVKSKRKSEIIREFYSSFKEVVKDKEKIDVRQFPASEGESRINYIMGHKKDEKMDKVEADKIFRKIYEFDGVYSNDFPYFQQQRYLIIE